MDDLQERNMRLPVRRHDRGIALLTVLLVTALLIALIFEFSYGTRISLNNAINFRDSQRAYYLARSAIFAFKDAKYGELLRQYTPQGQWGVVPMIGEGDTEVRFKWEDESGKIKINDIKNDNTGATLAVVAALFELRGIDTGVVKRINDEDSDIRTVTLLSGLQKYMTYEDFNKVSDSLTVSPVSQNKITINVNTASADVLQCLGIIDTKRIIEERQATPYTQTDLASTGGRLSGIVATLQSSLKTTSPLTTKSSGYYTVYSYATVGGYTKQIEAVVNGSSVTYWKAL